MKKEKTIKRAVAFAYIAIIVTALFLCDGNIHVHAKKCKHSYGSWQWVSKPTCTSAGSRIKTCSKCGNTVSGSMPATGHSYGQSTPITAGTCTSTGTARLTCSKCGDTTTTTTGKNPNNHVGWKTTSSVAATCEKEGSKTQTCTGCSATKTTTIKAKGHKWGPYEVTKKVRCKYDGEETSTCANCGEKKTRTITAPGSHDYGPYKTIVEKSCKTEGKRGKTCNRCGYTYEVSTGFGEHSYTTMGVIPGNCITPGKEMQVCLVCAKASNIVDLGLDPNNHVGVSDKYSRMVDNGVYHIYYYQCTGCHKEIRQEKKPCDCHYHSMYSYYGGHTPQGHMKYYACYAGDYSYSSGHYEKDPSCPSCTNAPGVKIISLKNGEILASGVLKVRVNLTDNENDKLTLKLFVDDVASPIETKQAEATRNGTEIEFSSDIDVSSLSEGAHKIKVSADDPISPAGSTEVSFLVDKTAPILNSVDIARSESGLSFVVDASDDISEVSAYRFTVDGVSKDYEPSGTYSLEGLMPDTEHSYKVEVKNGAGLVTEKEGVVYTCAHVPEVKPVIRSGRLAINTDNANPADTLYEVMVGDSFVNSSGKAYVLSETSESLSDIEKINIGNLEADNVYDIKVTVLGKDGLRYESETASIKTGKKSSLDSELNAPVVSGSSISTTSAFVSWSAIEGAVSYELEVDGTVYNLGNACEHTVLGLSAGTTHEYRVRARNSYTKSRFSDSLVITQEDVAPSIPVITKITGQGDFAKIMWDAVSGADHYELEINGEVVTDIKATAFVYHSASEALSVVTAGAITTEEAINVSAAAISEVSEEAEADLLSLETYTGETLNVRVRAVNRYGASSYSESASIERGAAAERLVSESLDAPEINVVSAGLTMIRLNWQAIYGASFYEIYVNGEKYADIAVNSVNIEDLMPDSEYVIKVCAIDENVSSESSVTVRTKSAGTSAYTDRTVSGLSDVHVNASAGSYYRLRLPLMNVADESRYTVTIGLDCNKTELVDMIAATKGRELPSEDGKFSFGNRNYFVYYKDEKLYITIVCETQYSSELYNAADILFKALSDGEIVFEVNR